MDRLDDTRALTLRAHATEVLSGAAGTEVFCRSGCVWITQYGDHRDIIVTAGQSFVLTLPTAVVLSAHRGARIELRQTVPRRRAWRSLLGWLDPRNGSAAARELSGRLRHWQDAIGGRDMRPL